MTSCGVTLEPDTVGVAHRTLPCGTQVEIRRAGKTAVVPVIDRGPFANDATFDLTKPVADELGVTGVDPISFVQRDDQPVVATPSSASR
jgi:rare lipoprotein A (peptidoglycan hydrolase)